MSHERALCERMVGRGELNFPYNYSINRIFLVMNFDGAPKVAPHS
jgi:hypothetical protein